MDSINDEYIEIIKRCKFISKEDEWFVAGTEAKLDFTFYYPEYAKGNKFNEICGLFEGLTMETFSGYDGVLPREDGETCLFNEFYIYDEFGNEISELTLEEYKNIINER